MFSSHFYLLVIVILVSIVWSVLFPMTVISPPSYFSKLFFSHCIDVSTLSSVPASTFTPFFLGTYSLSTSSLGYNALYLVIILVLWSICVSSFLVLFRRGPEYLTGGTAQVFIPLIRFRQESFVLSSFLVLLRYSFQIWSFITTCLMVSASKIRKYF